MAMRLGRFVPKRLFSSGGKVLSEEEKAAENIYIKRTEQEKLEKLARQGPKPAESSGGSTDVKPSTVSSSGASSEKVSTDKNRNYAVIAGTVAAFSALGWYLRSRSKKPEEVQD